MDFSKVKIEFTENSHSLITVTISKPDLIQFSHQLLVTYGINKALQNFEDYPNDIQRGFNIPHMPVFYRFKTGESKMVYS